MRAKKEETNSRWPLLVGWNTALFLLLLCVMFAGAETWYRFLVDRTGAAGPMRLTTRWHQRHYQFNEQGWRDNVAYELEPHAPGRITFLGDSFTEGSGIKSVDDRFSNILRARLPNTEIHVLARNGFGSRQHLKTTKYLCGMDYRTDAVVLAYMMNDAGCCTPAANVFANKMWRYNYSLSYPQRESYFLNTMSFRWKARTDPDLKKYAEVMHEAYRGDSWEQNTALLRELRWHLEAKGIPLLVVTFPFLQDLKRYHFGTEHQQLDAFWKSQGVPHLDLLPLFLEHANTSLVVHKRDAHPNEHANKLAAGAIQEFLTREGLAAERPSGSVASAAGQGSP